MLLSFGEKKNKYDLSFPVKWNLSPWKYGMPATTTITTAAIITQV